MKTIKLTFTERWMKFWGLGYFVNFGTKEIHKLENKTDLCKLWMITKGMFITRKKALRLIKKGFNGCCYCWPEEDNG